MKITTQKIEKTIKSQKKAKIINISKSLFIIGILIFLITSLIVMGIDSHVRKSSKNYIHDIDKISDVIKNESMDAVIILGAYVFPNGNPSTMLKDRLDTGIELYKMGLVNKIIVTGDHGQTDYDEVNAMRDYLVSKQIELEDVFMDHAGFNTYDSMFRARDVFLVDTAIIVTQEYHLMRAVYIARRLGLKAFGVNADKRLYANYRYYNMREIAARFKDFVQVNILSTKPKFLGEAIPVSGDGRLTEDGLS